MLISDHINLPGLSGTSPLIGPNENDFGPRFVPLSDEYDLHLRQICHKSALSINMERRLLEGTYCYVCGPT